MSIVTRRRKPLIVTQFLPEDGTTRPDALPPAVDPWSKDWDGGSLPTEEALPPSALATPLSPLVPPQPTPASQPTLVPPTVPLASPTSPLVSPPPGGFGVNQPFYPQPRKRRRGLVTGIVTVLVIAGAITAAVLVGHHGNSGNADASGFAKPSAGTTVKTNPKPSASPSATPSPSPATGPTCAIGTWTLTTETMKVDSGIFGTGSGTVTLTSSVAHETRTFNPDGTGELDVANTYTGRTSNGTDVAVVLTGKGTFTYAYDGNDVTYKTVVMPGTYEVDVNGAEKSSTPENPLETTGTDPMSCSGNTLIQHGNHYSRTYQRKAL